MGLMLILDAPRACRGETHEHDDRRFLRNLSWGRQHTLVIQCFELGLISKFQPSRYLKFSDYQKVINFIPERTFVQLGSNIRTWRKKVEWCRIFIRFQIGGKRLRGRKALLFLSLMMLLLS